MLNAHLKQSLELYSEGYSLGSNKENHALLDLQVDKLLGTRVASCSPHTFRADCKSRLRLLVK
jgi:hypothetical protein